nr:immunoglobulin light chain junction region [Macaca mulatta]
DYYCFSGNESNGLF